MQNLVLYRIYFKNESKIQIFLDKEIRKFVIKGFDLREILKVIFQVEGK